MDYSNWVQPTQLRLTGIQHPLIINTNYEVEIPDFSGYYYNLKEHCVYSTKKGNKYLPYHYRIKIYSESITHKHKPGEQFVRIERSSTHSREKVYLSDIRTVIYNIVDLYNKYIPCNNSRFILPALVYD